MRLRIKLINQKTLIRTEEGVCTNEVPVDIGLRGEELDEEAVLRPLEISESKLMITSFGSG